MYEKIEALPGGKQAPILSSNQLQLAQYSGNAITRNYDWNYKKINVFKRGRIYDNIKTGKDLAKGKNVWKY